MKTIKTLVLTVVDRTGGLLRRSRGVQRGRQELLCRGRRVLQGGRGLL